MSSASIPDAQRCRQATTANGKVIECNEVGGWVLDDDRRTWRPAKPGDRRRRCWRHGPASTTKTVGRNRREDKPNERLQRFAGIVLGLAPEVTKALREVDEELSLLGFPSSGGRGGSSTAGEDDGPVARDAVRIHELTAWREDLRDWIDDLADRLSVGMHIVRQIRRLPPAAMGAKLCSENQQDRDGSIEWGDACCTELPMRDGLCAACRERERVWRRDHDLATRAVLPSA